MKVALFGFLLCAFLFLLLNLAWQQAPADVPEEAPQAEADAGTLEAKPLEQIEFTLPEIPDLGPTHFYWFSIAAGGIVFLFFLSWLLGRWNKRRKSSALRRGNIKVPWKKMSQGGPAKTAPYLECYQIPVRLAYVVLAPIGRQSVLPSGGLKKILDQITMGLGRVMETHDPEIQLAPPQLSMTGFKISFFGAAALPGRRGKGTPWCAAAGPCEISDQQLVIGMIFCAAEENNLGQIDILQEYDWREVLRYCPAQEELKPPPLPKKSQEETPPTIPLQPPPIPERGE
ncbi:Hypothetical protein PBC10988_27310 [Planctomycetales bacterium 10988]|nr:Hypothetical protein PBC10988_27310 [Planctomycetales bacterium 10988]